MEYSQGFPDNKSPPSLKLFTTLSFYCEERLSLMYAKALFYSFENEFPFSFEINSLFPLLHYFGAPWGFEAPSVAGAELC